MKNTNDRMRVCVISPEIVGPHKNGGIGTHSYYLSVFLSRQLGQQVTFLYTGAIEHHDEAYWREWFMQNVGIEFVWITPSPIGDTQTEDPTSFVRTTAMVYEWLRDRPFDVCHFQEMLGNGFRCFQAKRMGLAFQQTVLTCTVHSSWEWINQAMQTFPQYGRTELDSKFMERYSIEHCDVLISPSRYMLDWVAENRIPVPARRHVLPYLFDPEIRAVGCRPVQRHVIFFGRLEVRKGILIFLDALRKLAAEMPAAEPPIRVTLLGRPGYTPDGNGLISVGKVRAEVAPAFTLQPLTDFGHTEAMEFLAKHNDALVVCPSLVDNSPYAIIECIELGLNIIAARSGGIPELFEGEGRLFEPTTDGLVSKLRDGLANLLPPLSKRYGAKSSREIWTAFCDKTLPDLRATMHAAHAAPVPPVHVMLIGNGSDSALMESLTSLESQSQSAASVTVARLEKGHAGEEVDRLCSKHGWKVVPAADAPGFEADSLVVVLRCGARLESQGIARLSASMTFSEADALSCRGIVRMAPGGADDTRAFEPTGACLEGGILFNTFGEAVFITHGRHLATHGCGLAQRAERNAMWRFLAGLAVLGKVVDVVPEVLVSFPRENGALGWKDLDYTAHKALLDAVSGALPDWLGYTLVNAVASARSVHVEQLERTVQTLQTALAKANAPKTRRSLGHKIKREARRVLQKLGLGGANGESSSVS